MNEQSPFFPKLYPASFTRPFHPLFAALLVDGDNIQLTETQLIRVLQEAGSMGEVAVRRVYGNWAATTKSAWKELVLRYAMKPCHHIHGAPGKNATDIALTVDAMDLFYSGITHFCFVTSDSDYTPLIQRLRASGCQVLGIGNPTKNASLILACDRFLSLDEREPVSQPDQKGTNKEIAKAAPKKVEAPSPSQKQTKKGTAQKKKGVSPPKVPKEAKVTKPFDDPELTQAIELAFDTVTLQQHQNRVLLIDVAKVLKEAAPTLRAKDYGKMTMLFVIKERTDLFTFRKIERDGKLLDEMQRHDAHSMNESPLDL